MVIDKLTIMGLSTRGAGTWAGQRGGGQLFQRALSILYVGSFNQHWSLIPLKHFNKTRVLSTSHKHYNIATKELKIKLGQVQSSKAQGCRSLLSIGEDNLQFYPNFALFSTLGDEPRPRFCSGEQTK